MTSRKPRKLKAPKPCRYCGHVCDTHQREATSQWTMPLYSCRDVSACGARLRAAKVPGGYVPVDDGIPF